MPYKYGRHCVCYGGTHDNATLKEWKEALGSLDEIEFAKEYFGISDNEDFNIGIIRGGMASVADIFITQMQDYLNLGKGDAEQYTRQSGRQLEMENEKVRLTINWLIDYAKLL